MKRFFLMVLGLSLVFLGSCKLDPETEMTLQERLAALPGLDVLAITPPEGFSQAFQVDVTQYVDHENPAQGTFKQRFYLSHRTESAPTVFYTSGYGIGGNSQSELARLLSANQVLLVHRYFPNARPDPLDWTFLTIWQAASDQHRVRELLKSIYTGKWVSGGASKGGMTALFYKRYYPQDVDATVAYVAPIMSQTDDPRFATFLKRVGSADCRQKIQDFQRQILGRRTAMLTLLSAHVREKQYSFTRVSMEAAFEYAVLEYPFAFWQYGQESACTSIPDAASSDQILFDHLALISPFSYYTDSDIAYFEPLYYQAYSEFGYCPYIYDHLQDLLKTVKRPSYKTFAPQVDMQFQTEVMQDLIPWLKSQGERIVYIYGGIDPWTAAALRSDAGVDALFILQSGANHRVRISQLNQRDHVMNTLGRWLGIQLSISWPAKAMGDDELIRSRF